MDDETPHDVAYSTEHPDDRGDGAAPRRVAERSAWERALDGPPINPRSSLIYHDPR